ncbi:MAG: hypothetical protein JF595_02720 [Sphingomonadales bacterium]|nr:hypothetical protein [Sphingomonadales bacterium]
MNDEFTSWRVILSDFARNCGQMEAQDQADRIREALALLNFVKDVSPQRAAEVERLLAAQAYESAAISLMEPETGFLLSRGPNGVCLASVVLAGQTQETTAEGSTLALALLRAKTLALIDKQ